MTTSVLLSLALQSSAVQFLAVGHQFYLQKCCIFGKKCLEVHCVLLAQHQKEI